MSIRRWPVGRLGTSVLFALWLCRTAVAQDAYYRGPDASRLAPRSALVLGISNYSDAMFPRLPNAETDITRMTQVLERLGFDIHPKSSGGPLTRQRLKVVLYDYIQHVRKVGGVSLIYFAGHGVGDSQHSYLVPYDGMVLYSRDLREELIPIDLLLEAVQEMSNAFHIVILDACRNPGLGQLRKLGTGAYEEASAGVIFEPPNNMVYATSAQAGQKARDGKTGETSPFASILSASIQVENQNIDSTFSDVKRQFLNLPPDAANGPQNPYSSNNGGANFFFRPNEQTFADEKKYWNAIPASANADDYRRFLQQFPAGYFAAQARAKRDAAPSPVTDPHPTQVEVLEDGTALRDSPMESSAAGKSYNKGTRGILISSSSDWMFLQMSDGELGYVASGSVRPVPLLQAPVILNYAGASDDPPAELDNLLNRFAISQIQHVSIFAHADQTAPGTALARIAKVDTALKRKGVGGASIEIKPLAPPGNPMHLKQVEVTLMVTN